MGRGSIFHFHNFPKRQPRINVGRVQFWKEFRVSQQQRAKAIKAAVERYKNAKRNARDHQVLQRGARVPSAGR